MSVTSVQRVGEILWDEVGEKVNRGLVFLDDPVAECLHWHGGLLRLLNAGATNVKEFSSFERGGGEDEKAVMIVSGSVLSEDVCGVCRDILQASHFRYTIFITTQPVDASQQAGAYRRLEEQLAQWMGNMNYTTEVFYFPLFTAAVSRDIFVTPSYCDLFPVLPTYVDSLRKSPAAERVKKGDKSASTGVNSLSDLTLTHLPLHLQAKIKSFAGNMNSLLERMRVKDECFALGDFSRIIANEIVNLPQAKQRRKSCSTTISLLLLDRTLDLACPSSHPPDSLVDKIIHCLPRLVAHTTDCAVDMSSLSSPSSPGGVVLPGCLAHPTDSVASALLHKIITSKEKESLIELNRQLVDAGSRERISIRSKVGRVTAEFLRSNLAAFKCSWSAITRYSGLLQLCVASVECMSSGMYHKWNELAGVEQGLVQAMGVMEGKSVLGQLTDMIAERKLSIEDILTLLVYIYSINGEDCADNLDEENNLQHLLCQLVLKECDPEPLTPIIKLLVGEDVNDLTISRNLAHFFDKLRSLGEVREQMKGFRSLTSPPSATHPTLYQPLLGQVAATLTTQPPPPTIQDIQYISGGLAGMIKSGISYFMPASQAKVSDAPVVLVYVVGGVSGEECKLLSDALHHSSKHMQILVGSSHITKTSDILQHLLSPP